MTVSLCGKRRIMEHRPSINDQFLHKVNQCIDDNLDNEHFTFESLAEDVGLSRSMLHRKLVKLTGKSATDLIMERRLSKARDLLEQNAATASEVAYRVGFNSPSYFNKVFKKYYNVPPGAVRKKWVDTGDGSVSDDDQSVDVILPSKKRKSSYAALIVSLLIIAAVIVAYTLINMYRPVEKSIAVLPLANLTGEEDNNYFVEGMHDALIGELGQIASLRVISRTSTLRYKDSELLLKDIANELGVNTIVEGSVSGVGDSLRILIQLIDVFPEERHLLANEYRDGMGKALAVQSNVAKDIAQTINVRLSTNERQRLDQKRTVDPETYKAYLRGMYYLNQGTEESFLKGVAYLQAAIERDPADPFAYAGLALAYATMGHGQLTSDEAFQRATAAANKAIKIDPTIEEAYTALSILNLYNTWDWPKTKESFESSLASNPNNEVAHAHFAWYHFLFDDIERSIHHAKKAVMIDPLSPSYTSWLSLLYFHAGDDQNAELYAKKAIDLKDDIPYGNLSMAWVRLRQGKSDEALAYLEKLPKNSSSWHGWRGCGYIKAGKEELALEIWNEMQAGIEDGTVNSNYSGMLAGCLGLNDLAFELLEDAYEKKYYPITYIDFLPCAEYLQDDPRYDELKLKMNLPVKGKFITATE